MAKKEKRVFGVVKKGQLYLFLRTTPPKAVIDEFADPCEKCGAPTKDFDTYSADVSVCELPLGLKNIRENQLVEIFGLEWVYIDE